MTSFTTTKELTDALRSFQHDISSPTLKGCRYVIYARKSTDDKDNQVRSLPDQISECERFAETNGLSAIDVIQEAESAKEPDTRPKFRDMMDKLKAGKYDGILAWHPDRLARNMKDAGEIIDLVDKGIIKDLKFVSFTFENNASGKMLLGITFVLSKQYSDHLSDNVSRGNRRSIEEGKYINRPKHGYYKDSNQYLRPDGENFTLIKNAFVMRLKGKTLDEIADYLNEKGYKRATKDGGHRSFNMIKSVIDKILKDPVYAGVLLYGKNNVADLTELYEFQPAISVSDFMKINHLDNKSQMIKLSKSYRKGEDVKANLMREMVICAHCGEAMGAGITIKKNPKGVKKYFYYRCNTDDCERRGKSVRAKVLIDHIKHYLEQEPFSSKTSYDHYVEEMKNVSAVRREQTRKDVVSFKARKRALEENAERARRVLASDEDEDIKADFKRDLANGKKDIAVFEEKIRKANSLIAKSNDAILTHAQFVELMKKVPEILGSTKKMEDLDYIIKKIFLNFTIRGKSVVNTTLNSPFDVLEQSKVSVGGR